MLNPRYKRRRTMNDEGRMENEERITKNEERLFIGRHPNKSIHAGINGA
jgi:hypothetical protein